MTWDWKGLDFCNSADAMEQHTQDPLFTLIPDPVDALYCTDDFNPDETATAAATTAVEVRPEAFEEALYNTEHLTPFAPLPPLDATAATTSSTESTAQSSSDYQTFEKLIDVLPLNATIHSNAKETLEGLTVQQLYKVANKANVKIHYLATQPFAKPKMIKLILSQLQSS